MDEDPEQGRGHFTQDELAAMCDLRVVELRHEVAAHGIVTQDVLGR